MGTRRSALARLACVTSCAVMTACGSNPAGPSTLSSGGPTSGTPTSGAPSDSTVLLADDLSGRRFFPSDNWWNQDIIERAARSAVERVHRLHRPHADARIRTSGRRRTASRTSASAARSRACRSPSSTTAARATTASAARSGYPIPEEAKTQPNFIEGGAPGGGIERRSPPAHRRSRPLAALRAVRDAVERRRAAVGGRLGRHLRPVVERAAPGRLDVGRRGGPGDPARARALRRGDARPDPSCAPRHGPPDERLRVAGLASRRITGRRAADGRAAAAQGVEGPLRAIPRTSSASSARCRPTG